MLGIEWLHLFDKKLFTTKKFLLFCIILNNVIVYKANVCYSFIIFVRNFSYVVREGGMFWAYYRKI